MSIYYFYNWLVLRNIYSRQWFDDFQVVLFTFSALFWDLLLTRSMMFLIAEEYVIHKGTIRGQKFYCHLERLTVPQFRFFLLCFNIKIVEHGKFVFQLDYESDFSTHTEITYHKVRDRIKKRSSFKFLLISSPS